MSLEFDLLDPFPLVDLLTVPYVLQKGHSKSVDDFFGFEIEAVEESLREETNAEDRARQWIGLPPESLQTPYTELRFMLEQLQLEACDRVVDLGAAYGRMGLVMHSHFPQCEFLGIEIASARVKEGSRVLQKHRIQNSKLIWGDAGNPNFKLPDARAYFLYDLSDRATIKKVIDQLRDLSIRKPIQVIGRGRATRDQIERNEPWLSQMVPPKHFGNFTIYSSA